MIEPGRDSPKRLVLGGEFGRWTGKEGTEDSKGVVVEEGGGMRCAG